MELKAVPPLLNRLGFAALYRSKPTFSRTSHRLKSVSRKSEIRDQGLWCSQVSLTHVLHGPTGQVQARQARSTTFQQPKAQPRTSAKSQKRDPASGLGGMYQWCCKCTSLPKSPSAHVQPMHSGFIPCSSRGISWPVASLAPRGISCMRMNALKRWHVCVNIYIYI